MPESTDFPTFTPDEVEALFEAAVKGKHAFFTSHNKDTNNVLVDALNKLVSVRNLNRGYHV